MTSGLGLGLLASLASAFALNWGFFAQHGAASALPPLSTRRPLHSLRLLFMSRRWLFGFIVGLGGWALYIAALTVAPLSLVQAVSAGGIGVLALLVHFRGGDHLSRAEWLGIGSAVLGLVLLGASLVGRPPAGNEASPSALGPWLLGSAAVAALAAGPGGLVLSVGAGLGISAGVLYAAGDVATKAATGGLLVLVPVILVAHGLAFACLQLGFQRGRVMATVGLSTLFTNALPIAAGVVLFGERLPGGALGALRLAAFALVTGSAAILARPSGKASGQAITPASTRSRRRARFRRRRYGAVAGSESP
jgi:hypothetical protein